MNKTEQLILGTASPRRIELMKQAGYVFEVQKAGIKEIIGDDPPEETVMQIAAQKALHLEKLNLNEGVWILTADTLVVQGNTFLGKPAGYAAAYKMLKGLSGKEHKVLTGVCLKQAGGKIISFYDLTRVHFRTLTSDEINFYIQTYEPYDKAGAYGIQEWIGLIGITSIYGSYFNVMGLPVHKVYKHIQQETGTAFLRK